MKVEVLATFSHPLARNASIWDSGGVGGPPRRMLVVVTTIALSPDDPRHKSTSVERLTEAVRGWVTAHPDEAVDFVLMNRPKNWAGDRST